MKQLLQDLKSGVTSVQDVPAPQAGAGQILVRVRASAVSAGTERMLVDFAKSGLLGKARKRPDLARQALAKMRRDGILTVWEAAQSRLDQPLPLGYSCAGVVEEVGEGVEGFSVGDRVACAGAGYANHAEYVAVPQNLCALLPEGVSFDAAALTTLGAIALQGFRLSEARLGETVAVIGLGLLGQLTARIAKAAGCRVFGFDLSEGRAKAARAAGIEATTRDKAEAAGSAFTAGRGFDHVLIAADGETNDPIEFSAVLAKDRGTVVAIGNVGLNVPRTAFYRKELTLKVSRSYGPGRYDATYEEGGVDYPYAYVRWTEQRNLQEFVRLLAEKTVDFGSVVTHRLPFSSATQAYALISSPEGRDALGVVLTYGEAAARERRVEVSSIAAGKGGVGVLGAGQFSGVLLPILKASGAALRGVASLSGTKAKAAADKFGFAFAASSEKEVLEDAATSTVVVLTRHDRHAAHVLAGLAAGKNVFVEKPLCLSVEELERIEAARLESKGALAVGFNRRFAPFSAELKAAFSGARGPKAVAIRVNAGTVPAGHWTVDPAIGGGRLVGEGCHFVDWANFVVGLAPKSADCRPIGREAGEQDWSLRLSYPDGSVADIVYVTSGDSGAGKERYEVHAGGVSAVLEDFRKLSIHAGARSRSKRAWLKADKGHAAQWNGFWAAVCFGKPAPVPWEDVAATMRATFAAQRSLRSGKPELLQP